MNNNIYINGASLLSFILLLAMPAVASGKEPFDIRNGNRQLFLDDAIIEKSENVRLEQGEVVKRPDNPILRRDKPWDATRCDLYGSVVYDRDKKVIQLFYSANNVSNGHEDRLAYAESRDGGKTWVKPEFTHIPYKEHKRTNLVMLPPAMVMHGPCVFRDEHESDPARRYKLFTSSYPDTAYLGMPRIYMHRGMFLYRDPAAKLPPNCAEPGMYVAYSPDGIHWTCSGRPVTDMLSDTAQCAFWDARIGKYVAYVRARTKNDRSVARMESADFENWSEPKVVLEAAPTLCLYSMGVVPYEGVYIGTPWLFDHTANPTDRPVIWPELAFSRDGIKWRRLFPGKPLIPTGPKGSPDSRQIRLASSWIVLDDKILFFFGQTKRPHISDMQVDIGMATMRRDGFAALTAEKPGIVTTKPLRFDAGRLSINAETSPGGYVKAEIIDAQGQALPGYSLDESVAFSGDSTSAKMEWHGKPRVPDSGAGGLRIRFVLSNAKLYSFWIDKNKSG
ncbi:MAG: exo-alpha-sialidase [Pirellulales bacterium]|nr:exo-alpha-sialidase [Pirellulales bacterium]